MADSNTASAVGLMDVSAVAGTLAVKPILVSRLVARGKLAATPLNNGELVFDPPVVKAYILGGSQDLQPPSTIVAGWFRADLDTVVATGEKLASLGRQTITPETVAPLAKEQMAGYSFGDKPGVTIRQSLNDLQRRYLAQPSSNPAYRNIATEFMAAQLRQAAKKIIENTNGPIADKAAVLYGANYDKITSAALARMPQVMAYSQTCVVFVNDGDGQPHRVIVSAALPMTEIIGLADSPATAF